MTRNDFLLVKNPSAGVGLSLMTSGTRLSGVFSGDALAYNRLQTRTRADKLMVVYFFSSDLPEEIIKHNDIH